MNPQEASLHALLGPLPKGIEKLTPDQQKSLHNLLLSAHQNQSTQYTNAFEAALKHVPALLRGTVRKIILG